MGLGPGHGDRCGKPEEPENPKESHLTHCKTIGKTNKKQKKQRYHILWAWARDMETDVGNQKNQKILKSRT